MDRHEIEFGGVYKNTLSLNIGGTSAAGGISWEHLFTKNLMMDIGIGYLGGGAGFKIYPWSVKRGTIRPDLNLSTTFISWPNTANLQSFYSGIGFTYFGISPKFNYHIDIGPAYFYHYANSINEYPDRFVLMGNIKIGYRFSFVSMKKRKTNFKVD